MSNQNGGVIVFACRVRMENLQKAFKYAFGALVDDARLPGTVLELKIYVKVIMIRSNFRMVLCIDM